MTLWSWVRWKTLQVESQGSKFDDVEKVLNNDSNSITPIENWFVWCAMDLSFYWDGIMVQTQGMDTNFYMVWLSRRVWLLFLSSLHNDYLKKNPDEAKSLVAIKKATNMLWRIPEEAKRHFNQKYQNSKIKRISVLASKYLSNMRQIRARGSVWG